MIVTGATGQLGTAFKEILPEATFLTRNELDLTDATQIQTVVDRLRPSGIINCAAFTAVDEAESHEKAAHLLNAVAVGKLARVAASLQIPFVTFSTDYVFDGASERPYLESDPPAPINAYGRTKRAGEELALVEYTEALIVRTSWVISGTHPNFVATMLKLASEREVQVVDDQHGCPTVAPDLARATVAALDAGATGILHLTNQGPTTWFELAREAVRLAGLDPNRITPCQTDDFPRPAPRPANSVLASERLDDLGLEALPPWRDSLGGVVERLSA